MMRNLRGDVLAIMAVLLLGGTIFGLFTMQFPEGSKEVLLIVIGVLAGLVKDVYSFEFGSSKDSQRNAQAVVDLKMTEPARNGGGPLKAADVLVEAEGNVNVTREKK